MVEDAKNIVPLQKELEAISHRINEIDMDLESLNDRARGLQDKRERLVEEAQSLKDRIDRLGKKDGVIKRVRTPQGQMPLPGMTVPEYHLSVVSGKL